MAEEDGPKSLTGVWNGLYSYPGGFSPTPFTATLVQIGDGVSGTTHEIAEIGPAAGRRILASLDGRRRSDHVVFVKVYEDLGPENPYDQRVIYEGVISDDGLEITGQWRIAGDWSGKFMMMRPGRKASAARRHAFASA